jgi:hypothetical protein
MVAATSLPHRCHIGWSGLLRAHILVEGHICLLEGRICWQRGTYVYQRGAYACVRGAHGRLWGAYGCWRGAYAFPRGTNVCTPLPRPFVPPREHSRPPLFRVRPLHMLEMLAWKSTSPSNVPCQPTVLTRDKM